MSDQEFLQWIHARLTEVHGDNRNMDFMIRLRGIIKVTGELSDKADNMAEGKKGAAEKPLP